MQNSNEAKMATEEELGEVRTKNLLDLASDELLAEVTTAATFKHLDNCLANGKCADINCATCSQLLQLKDLCDRWLVKSKAKGCTCEFCQTCLQSSDVNSICNPHDCTTFFHLDDCMNNGKCDCTNCDTCKWLEKSKAKGCTCKFCEKTKCTECHKRMARKCGDYTATMCGECLKRKAKEAFSRKMQHRDKMKSFSEIAQYLCIKCGKPTACGKTIIKCHEGTSSEVHFRQFIYKMGYKRGMNERSYCVECSDDVPPEDTIIKTE